MDTSSIVVCKDRLQEQLQKAKESLKGVDDNLKKFVSRNISDVPLRQTFNKSTALSNEKWKSNKEENFPNNFRRRPARVLNDTDIENIPVKKRLGPKVLHSSISGPPRKFEGDEDNYVKKPAVLSCVVAKPHVLPSRKDALSVRTYTETRARDRRMFGALLGTLQKFRQEETQLKDKEDKKAKVERKLEEAAKREKEKLRLERQKLMDLRKQKESYIKAVENNMKLVKEQEEWEELQKPLFNYIRTETTPSVCYLPKVHNEKSAQLLQDCQLKLSKLIEEKRKSVKEEVDSLISQWQNVDIEEMMGKGAESTSDVGCFADDSISGSDKFSNLSATNGASFNCDAEASRKFTDHEAEYLYSAKEQRFKKKSNKTEDVAVKEEKYDDYDIPISVKQEKDTPLEMAVGEDDVNNRNLEREQCSDGRRSQERLDEENNIVKATSDINEEISNSKSVDELDSATHDSVMF